MFARIQDEAEGLYSGDLGIQSASVVFSERERKRDCLTVSFMRSATARESQILDAT